MRRKIVYASMVTALACRAFGQTPEFDAVSVKPNHSESGNSHSDSHQGVLTATNVTLKSLIMRAYGVLDYQISGPEWLSSERFDVAAKPPVGSAKEDLPLMMRAMLTDRFKLAGHRESRMSPVFGLVVAKGGPKFKNVKDEDNHGMSSGRGAMKCDQCSMEALAAFLARQVERPVLDMTELKGVFDFTLNWTPENAAREDSDKIAGVTYPALVTALQEQLGLRIEAKKAPLEILIIDHAERVPSEN